MKWEEEPAEWRVVSIQPGETNLTFAINGSGAFAVVTADGGIYAPPQPAAGELLSGTSIGFNGWQSLQAIGTVTPSITPASRVAELVRASAQITVTNSAGAIPSGLVLRCLVEERYTMADGSLRVLPQYETHILASQQPGDQNPNTVAAGFPLQPLLLFGGDELKEADVKVEVFPPAPFSGGILGPISAGDVIVTASGGSVSNRMTAELKLVPATNFFSLAGTNVERAFQLSIGTLPEGRKLAAQFGSGASNAFYVLAKVISRDGLY